MSLRWPQDLRALLFYNAGIIPQALQGVPEPATGLLLHGVLGPMNPIAPSSTAAAAAAAPAAPDYRWTVAAQDFAALGAGPVRARLDDHSVLEFDGPDAVSFLQGQTTIDIAALGETDWQLGGYCTPKGRLLAIFQAWRYATGVRLLVPTALAAGLQRRLTQYVLRAKVQIRDVSHDWQVLGLCGKGAAAALAQAGCTPPEQAWQCLALDGGERLARLTAGPQAGERLVLLMRQERAARWGQALTALPLVGTGLWWWSQIDAALPAIVPQTQERFVPQALNLEVLGGVNFRKGCYPGQEIVARSQYLGKLRRRMAAAHAPALGSDADIHADGQAEAVGRIVLAATAPEGGWDLLFECPTEMAAAALHAGGADAPVLQRRSLPYELFDPTA